MEKMREVNEGGGGVWEVVGQKGFIKIRNFRVWAWERILIRLYRKKEKEKKERLKVVIWKVIKW